MAETKKTIRLYSHTTWPDECFLKDNYRDIEILDETQLTTSPDRSWYVVSWYAGVGKQYVPSYTKYSEWWRFWRSDEHIEGRYIDAPAWKKKQKSYDTTHVKVYSFGELIDEGWLIPEELPVSVDKPLGSPDSNAEE